VAEQSGEGGPWGHDLHCFPGLFCATNKLCVPLLAAGLSCSNTTGDWDDACASGDCERGPGGYVCRAECTLDSGM